MTLEIYAFVIETLRLLAPVMREIAQRDADLARQTRSGFEHRAQYGGGGGK